MAEQKIKFSPLWVLYEQMAMLFGFGLLGILCLAWFPVALLFTYTIPKRHGSLLGRWAIMQGCRLYLFALSTFCACRFDLKAVDRLQIAPPTIISPNHPSLLDAILILSRLPNVVCVMKASLMVNPLLGAALRLARYIPNVGMAHIVKKSQHALKAGAHVLIFPEGTRTQHFPINPISPVVSLIAKRNHLPVQTLLIHYSSPYLAKSWPLFRKPTLPLLAQIQIGQRFEPNDDLHAFTSELQTYFNNTVTMSEKNVTTR